MENTEHAAKPRRIRRTKAQIAKQQSLAEAIQEHKKHLAKAADVLKRIEEKQRAQDSETERTRKNEETKTRLAAEIHTQRNKAKVDERRFVVGWICEDGSVETRRGTEDVDGTVSIDSPRVYTDTKNLEDVIFRNNPGAIAVAYGYLDQQ